MWNTIVVVTFVVALMINRSTTDRRSDSLMTGGRYVGKGWRRNGCYWHRNMTIIFIYHVICHRSTSTCILLQVMSYYLCLFEEEIIGIINIISLIIWRFLQRIRTCAVVWCDFTIGVGAGITITLDTWRYIIPAILVVSVVVNADDGCCSCGIGVDDDVVVIVIGSVDDIASGVGLIWPWLDAIWICPLGRGMMLLLVLVEIGCALMPQD